MLNKYAPADKISKNLKFKSKPWIITPSIQKSTSVKKTRLS